MGRRRESKENEEESDAPVIKKQRMDEDKINTGESKACSENNDNLKIDTENIGESKGRLEGVDYSHSVHDRKSLLDELPAHDDPRLPESDELRCVHDESLENTYKNICLLPAIYHGIRSGRNTLDKQCHGVAYATAVENAPEMMKEFLMKAIVFKNAGTKAINLSRVNAYCPHLSMEPIEGEYLNRENLVLQYDHKPVQCISVVMVVDSSLTEPRPLKSALEDYVVKDLKGHCLKMELERIIAAIGVIKNTDSLYLTGSSIGDPLMTFSTNFTKLRTMQDRLAKGNSSKAASIKADEYEAPVGKGKPKIPAQSEKPKVFLYPTDEVPIYDFSSFYFDFNTHFDDGALDEDFTRIIGEPPKDSRCLVCYYPSIWRDNGMNVLRFNVKWVGVLDV